MKVIHAANVGHAFKQGVKYLLVKGVESGSRNGAVLRAPYPVTTVYRNPRQRVLVNDVRRANPFFHLMESMWMLAGRNDIGFVARYNKRMAEYSDDGVTQPAAYGHRWRNHFGVDQLQFVVDELTRNRASRRAVMTMADPITDTENARNGGADLPCNTGVYFIIRADGALDMTVTCRSNDAIWGCYGANVVHFSFLHEFVSLVLGVPLGRYYQVSNDLHAYTNIYDRFALAQMVDVQSTEYPYTSAPLMSQNEELSAWLDDMNRFFDGDFTKPFRTVWWECVVMPMQAAWGAYKSKDYALARSMVLSITAEDWRVACQSWLNGIWSGK